MTCSSVAAGRLVALGTVARAMTTSVADDGSAGRVQVRATAPFSSVALTVSGAAGTTPASGSAGGGPGCSRQAARETRVVATANARGVRMGPREGKTTLERHHERPGRNP